MMYDTSDFRNGLKVEMDGNPYVMVYFQFVKPGKGTAFTRTKLKNMRTGAVIERTFRTGEKLQAADVDEVNANYLYDDGTFAYFMNQQTYEQVTNGAAWLRPTAIASPRLARLHATLDF